MRAGHSLQANKSVRGCVVERVSAAFCRADIHGVETQLVYAASMPLVLRPATSADVPLILTFIRGLAEFERLLHEVEATEARLHATLFPSEGRPAAECTLAFLDDEAAGFAIYFTSYSTFQAKPGLYLEDLFVKPERRGRGIGKALLLDLARRANERGCGRMEWTVLEWNESAIQFYESIGAERKREWQLCRLTGDALARLK